MTYNDYLDAYNNGLFDIADVNFLAMLVDYSYVPNPSHKLDDIKGLIIAVPFVVQGDDMATLGMGEIISNAEKKIKEWIETYSNQVAEAYRIGGDVWNYGRYVVMLNPELEILCYCEPINQHLTNGN